LTGEAAREWLETEAGIARAAAGQLKIPTQDLVARIAALQDERKSLDRQLADAKKQLAMGGASGGAGAAPEALGSLQFLGRILEGVGGKDVRDMVHEARQQLTSGVAAFVGVDDGKAAVAVAVTPDLAGRIDAVALVRAGAELVGGKGGGGKPDLAQAGGPDGAGAEAALAAIREAVRAASSG